MTEQEILTSWLVAADNLGSLYARACAAGKTRDVQACTISAQLHVLELFKSLSYDTSVAELPFKAAMTALEGAANGRALPILQSTKSEKGSAKDDPIRTTNKAVAVALVKWLIPGFGTVKIKAKQEAAGFVAKSLARAGMKGSKGGPLPVKTVINWLDEGSLDLDAAKFERCFPPVEAFFNLSLGARTAKLNEIARDLMAVEAAAKGEPEKPH